MGRAKDIIIKPINARTAVSVIKKIHYSGKVAQNSQLNFGVFLDGKLLGAMQFGPAMDKRKMLSTVNGSEWNDFLELNRMAFSDELPKFSESRAIGVALRLIKKTYPQIKWVISFSDATQCGDGTIYRASGFDLIGIKENKTLYKFPTGDIIAGMTIESCWTLPIIKKQCDFLGIAHKPRTMAHWKKHGAKPLPGFQLKYIYFIDKSCREKLTVPIIPFSKIEEMGAGMYLGKARVKQAIVSDQDNSGGAAPTDTLQRLKNV